MCLCECAYACVRLSVCDSEPGAVSAICWKLVSFTYSQRHKGRGTQRRDRERNGREPGINLLMQPARGGEPQPGKLAISIRLPPLKERASEGPDTDGEMWGENK